MSKDYGHTTFGVHAEISTDSIVTSDQRRSLDPEHLKQLTMSITRHGLINPITVYSIDSKPPYQLLAGAHRLEAIRSLKLTRIPARVYDRPITGYELKAIEVFENLHRKDLNEVEKATATKELHELMQRINGPKSGASGHSMRDTAKMLGRSIGSVSQDIKLAQAVESIPELKLGTIDNKSTALRILDRLRSATTNAHLVQNATLDQGDRRQELIDSYIVGDFFVASASLTPSSYDFIEVDPPYGVDLNKLHEKDKAHNLAYNEVAPTEYVEFMNALVRRCYDLASTNAWLVLWFPYKWYHECTQALTRVGWKYHAVPGIWKKGNSVGRSFAPDTQLGHSYEQFLYASKGSPRLHLPGHSDMFDYPIPNPNYRIHPTERPKELIADLLRTFTWPGTNVLVPFAGSGNSLVAAHEARYKCVGFDLSQEYYNAFVARVLNG